MPKLRVPDLAAALARARAAAVPEAEARLRAFAQRTRDDFVDRIRAQRFESFRRVPLSWAWQMAKAHHRLDPRVMIATGAYTNSIQVFESRERGVLTFRVGIHPNKAVYHHVNGMRRRIPMWRLALVHEHGSSAARVPARPHWGPYFLHLTQQVAPHEAREMVRAVGRKVGSNRGAP